MSIIHIRGTGGSGKSTIVRRVMEKYSVTPKFIDGRKRPIGYECGSPSGVSIEPLFIPGHYEVACGGCDTISTPDLVDELINDRATRGFNILYEGIIIQDAAARCIALHKKYPLTVIELTTSIQDCLAGIQARRDAREDTRPLNPANTIARADRVRKSCSKLRDAGVKVLKLDREEAYQECLRQLGWVE